MNKLYFFLFLISYFLVSCKGNFNPEKTENHDSMLLRVLVGDKYGFIDETGKIVIEPQFDNAGIFFKEGVCFAEQNGRKGLINKEGMFIVDLPDSIRWVEPFANGIAEVYVNDRYYPPYCIDLSGNYILGGQELSRISNDNDSIIFALSSTNDGWYFIDINGNRIGELYTHDHPHFKNGLCVINRNDKCGVIDTKGKLVIDTIYDWIDDFSSDGIARAVKDSIYFYIDRTGRKLFECERPSTNFVCNRAIVILDGNTWLVNSSGQKIRELTNISHNDISHDTFGSTDCLMTIRNREEGVSYKIDTLGNIVLTTNYSDIEEFRGGLAYVFSYENHNRGYINREGKEIIMQPCPSVYSEIHEFNSSDSKIRALNTDNGIAYFDLDGNLIGKDMPLKKINKPEWRDDPRKKDYIAYFDSRLYDLDPIEGIYYRTIKKYWQSRQDPQSIGLNESSSSFVAIIRTDESGEYETYYLTGYPNWEKFIKIGESDNYAIMASDEATSPWELSEGKMTLNDPFKFEFKLECGHNDYYNFFHTYEYLKDYPPLSEYEKIEQVEWTGTGFAIADGFIATNYHVTNGAKSIRIRGINGDMSKTFKGTIVAKDKENDLSIIRITDKNFDKMGSIPYKIGKTSVDVGEDIFVLGYPVTSAMGIEVKVTDGIISASTGYKGNTSLYQISAPVQPGNSGGPLFNEEGTVIGIVCGKLSDAENVNYAVKISNLYSLINTSKLGISVSDNTIKETKRSKIVKKVKNYVYLIECSSK